MAAEDERSGRLKYSKFNRINRGEEEPHDQISRRRHQGREKGDKKTRQMLRRIGSWESWQPRRCPYWIGSEWKSATWSFVQLLSWTRILEGAASAQRALPPPSSSQASTGTGRLPRRIHWASIQRELLCCVLLCQLMSGA